MIKSTEEIELIRESSLLVSKTLAEIAQYVKPGIHGKKLDEIAESFLRDHGASPSFKGYRGFPNTLCISINEAIVHGIPSDQELKEGDVVSIDCGAYMNGFHGDQAYTFALSGVDEDVKKLLSTTRKALFLGIDEAVVGKRIGDIGYAIFDYCERQFGFGVVRELVGHGLGKQLHEDPEVPNYGKRGSGPKLKENMVLAIEPMVNLGTKDILVLDDRWTIITRDRKPSAHYEHDIVVKKNKAEILTDFDPIDQAVEKNIDLELILSE